MRSCCEFVVGIVRNVNLLHECGRMYERPWSDLKVKGRRPDVVIVLHWEMGC
jgi:hypothetical protein